MSFPSPEAPLARYQTDANGGLRLTDYEKRIIELPYYSSQTTYPPRYYQRNAVNRAVDAIDKERQRLLLVMATGIGKIYAVYAEYSL